MAFDLQISFADSFPASGFECVSIRCLWMLHFPTFMTCFAEFFSLLDFKRGFRSFGLFLCGFCKPRWLSLSTHIPLAAIFASAAFMPFVGLCRVDLLCYQLQSVRSDRSVLDRRWVRSDAGPYGGLAGDAKVYPQLSGWNYIADTSRFNYYPKGYSSSSESPVLLGVYNVPSLTIAIADGQEGKIPAILDSFGAMKPYERSCINRAGVTFDENGDPIVDLGTYNIGKVVGGGVVTRDPNGNIAMSYPDATGYVPGYEEDEQGNLRPVWYDPEQQTVSGFAPSSANPPEQRNALSYDPETQQYSFELPDYSSQLSAIREQLVDLNQKEVSFSVPPPVVNVNPEITVNPPEVNVAAPVVNVNPEITVNPPEVNVSVNPPEVNVSVNPPVVNVAAPVVNVPSIEVPPYNGPASNDFQTSATLADIDTSLPAFDTDEQNIVQIYQGWETGFPGIESAANMGLDALLGPIPQIDKTLSGPSLQLGNFQLDFDFSAYSRIIGYFRAACLFALLLVFGYAVWNTIVQSLQI